MKTHLLSQSYVVGEVGYKAHISVCNRQGVFDVDGNLEQVTCADCLRRVNADRKRANKKRKVMHDPA